MNNRDMPLEGCIGCGAILVIALIAFLMLSTMVMVMIGIAYTVYAVVQWFFAPQPRPFGAWPMSRWVQGYEYGLFELEQATGIAWNTTPLRLIVGSSLLGLVPLLVVGWLISFVAPSGILCLPMLGALLGLLTGLHLAVPRHDWLTAKQGHLLSDLEGVGDLSAADLALLHPVELPNAEDWFI